MSDKITRVDLVNHIRHSLGLEPKSASTAQAGIINEAYVVATKTFNLPTELLSQKNKTAHLELLQQYIDSINNISAQLDAVDRGTANSNHSEYRSLKIDETYNLNAAFLHGLFFDNISDLRSQITMDSLTYMRLERDFG
ncbi:MAG TPA: hypothetical protein EYG51_25100, partial [Pseudomonadales bacterium]|nr:hypothetical protein [Pseudomonadales bacterium]